MYCAHCGKPVSDQAKFCPACGYPTRLGKKLMQQGQVSGQAGGGVNLPSSLSSLDPQKKRIVAAAVAAVLVIGGAGGYYYHTTQNKPVPMADSLMKKSSPLPSKQKPQAAPAPGLSKKDPSKTQGSSFGNDVDAPAGPSNRASAPAKPAGDPDKAVFNDPAVKADAGDPGKVFVYFHKNISGRHLQEAYNCFSPDYQNAMGAYNAWAQGYSTTVASIPQNVQVTANDGSNATVTFRLKAVDKDGNGGQKTQYFRGTCHLINVDGLWKINDMTVSGD